MKISFKSLMAAALLLAITMPVKANGMLTLFDGAETSNLIPINNAYLDEVGTRTQVIYPAESLSQMINEVINSITFYTQEPITESGGNLQLSIGETAQTAYLNATTYVEGLTPIANFPMAAGVTEVTIVFDRPYYYQGGNLVIETLLTEAATNYCFISYLGTRPENYNAISRGEVSKFLPKTSFDYGTNEEYSAKVVPSELTFNTVRAGREDIQYCTITNNGQQGITPSLSVGAPFRVEQPNAIILAGESLDVPITFAPLGKGNYDGTLSIDCGQAGILEVLLHGTAIDEATDLSVCDTTDYASFVPIYGADIDVVNTEGQMIYPAEMLADMAGGKILSLKFHTKNKIEMNGGTIELSLKVVDNTSFASAVLESGVTAVATVSPEYGGTDLEFFFNEPYSYQGGNLLVDCKVTEAGTTNHRQTFFYGTPTEYNASVYKSIWFGSTFDTEFVPFLPKVTFSYQKADVLRGDVNRDGFITISDVTVLIDYLLTGAEAPAEADCNLDSTVSISDVTKLIDFLLIGSWGN